MPSDREEPNRVLGFPVRTHPPALRRAEPAAAQGAEPHPLRGDESQRVLGLPVDWLDQVGRILAPALERPLRAFKKRARRRPRP